MSIWMGLAHVAGAFAVIVVLGFVYAIIGAKIRNGIALRELDMIALKLGVSVEELDDLASSNEFNTAVLERNSPDLARNRLSDVLGLLSRAVSVAEILAIIAAVIAVAVVTFEDGAGGLVIFWAVPAIMVLSASASLVISAFCYILTGRAPGQASATRKELAKQRTGRTPLFS